GSVCEWVRQLCVLNKLSADRTPTPALLKFYFAFLSLCISFCLGIELGQLQPTCGHGADEAVQTPQLHPRQFANLHRHRAAQSCRICRHRRGCRGRISGGQRQHRPVFRRRRPAVRMPSLRRHQRPGGAPLLPADSPARRRQRWRRLNRLLRGLQQAAVRQRRQPGGLPTAGARTGRCRLQHRPEAGGVRRCPPVRSCADVPVPECQQAAGRQLRLPVQADALAVRHQRVRAHHFDVYINDDNVHDNDYDNHNDRACKKRPTASPAAAACRCLGHRRRGQPGKRGDAESCPHRSNAEELAICLSLTF
ncbi:hypothetical protein BOX15_Mlig004373g1, partial [Macrostomum lignano]